MSSELPLGRLGRYYWRALTSLQGFEFQQEPQLTRRELIDFGKAIKGARPWSRLTREYLCVRVTAIFEIAWHIYKSEGGQFLDRLFYTSVARKASKNTFENHDIFRRVIDMYVGGLKRAAARSESHVYVDRPSIPTALSVVSWIELTEGTIITVTTKKPIGIHDGAVSQQNSRKRSIEVLDDARVDSEAKAPKIQLEQTPTERDKAHQELQEVKSQMHHFSQQLEAAKDQYTTQAARLANAEQEVKNKATELERAEAERKALFKAVNAVHQDQNDMLAKLKQQYDDRASKYFDLAEAELAIGAKELALVKRERDQSQKTLADCARIIESFSSKLNGENGGG